MLSQLLMLLAPALLSGVREICMSLDTHEGHRLEEVRVRASVSGLRIYCCTSTRVQPQPLSFPSVLCLTGHEKVNTAPNGIFFV